MSKTVKTIVNNKQEVIEVLKALKPRETIDRKIYNFTLAIDKEEKMGEV